MHCDHQYLTNLLISRPNPTPIKTTPKTFWPNVPQINTSNPTKKYHLSHTTPVTSPNQPQRQRKTFTFRQTAKDRKKTKAQRKYSSLKSSPKMLMLIP
jgi:hypothetical protein